MDLRDPVALNLHIDSSSEQIVRGRGFDHNWVLNTNGDVTKTRGKSDQSREWNRTRSIYEGTGDTILFR